MLPLLLLLIEAATATPKPTAAVGARAMGRVLQPTKVNREEWERAPSQKRTEVLRTEGDQKVLIRIVDFE